MAWVSPQRLIGRWQPEMFRAEYLELDRELRGSNEYVALREFVHIDTAVANDSTSPRWRADTLEIKRSYGTSRDVSRGSLPDYSLPAEAILVARRWASEPSVHYWNESLYSGGGTASPNLWVLASNSGESIAWLERELSSEIGLRQLQRAGIGSVHNMLSSDLLLDIQVRRRDIDERRALNEVLLRNLRSDMYSASYRALRRPIILTGETFEERLREFERFLSEDTLFDSADAFFVEAATRNESSNLFVIRSIGQRDDHSDASGEFLDTDTSEVDAAWRNWYWSDFDENPYRIFNSLLFPEFRLPNHLLTRTTAARLSFAPEGELGRFGVPGFEAFASAFDDSFDLTGEFSESEFADNWLESNEQLGLTAEIESLCEQFGVPSEEVGQLARDNGFVSQLGVWATATYRPALAVRVIREQRIAGAYLLFGSPQTSAANESYGWLDDMGMAFQEILSPPPQIVEEAARRESLRRLSWLMHQINSPVGKARRALQDIHEFLQHQPTLAEQLVPDKETVQKRLQTRQNADPSRFTLASRLAHAMKQIEDVRRVAYQVKRLKRVQGELPHREFDLIPLLRERIHTCAEGNVGLDVDVDLPKSLQVTGNAESIREAIEEVLHNACREMAEHHVTKSTIVVRTWVDDSHVHFSISDNGLPAGATLMNDPFEEDASTYAKKGRGSGLGLAIVRETFAAHGGDCSLTENYDGDGERISGVTFSASMSITTRRNS
ncbi:sensor histidine kinase [Roseiconus lacunae]|uniref:histidine kinase n=1 Tax=Roseiconus lacunae TaxID=2605694 RepID=A0ABT7PNV0_9BACT|nr:HAMP domain-containing sensor histidine kinase [Roseiconus lacunae]MDM4018187.1 HAMP domain-containing sensor histidine kinase [Roseiconus lacunae]